MNSENDYILYVTQDAYFVPKVMFIPANLFLEVRKEDYLLLKEHSLKNKVMELEDGNYTIRNLLLQNYNYEGSGFGFSRKYEYTFILNTDHHSVFNLNKIITKSTIESYISLTELSEILNAFIQFLIEPFSYNIFDN